MISDDNIERIKFLVEKIALGIPLSPEEQAEIEQFELAGIYLRAKANSRQKMQEGLEKRNLLGIQRLHKPQWQWLSVAAAVLFIVGASGLLIYNAERDRARKTEPIAGIVHDIQPGGNKAILTLGNGSQIVLNRAGAGTIAQQGGTQVVKLDSGQLTYNTHNHGQAESGEVMYNTIITPRGGQYKIVLPDGSKVWLNAASSLRFPTSFISNKDRSVTLTGEAYFEVAKDMQRPFKVHVNSMQVDVLGTSFDIMAYQDEKVLKTTLLEGSVKVESGNNLRLLAPGQQAQLQEDGLFQVKDDANSKESIAWVNGRFEFKRDSIESVMRQLARWYDVEIVYKSRPHQTFTGEISRENSAADVLTALKASGGVNFEIDGKKIIVLQ